MFGKVTSSYIFWVFGMTRPRIEPRSPGALANTLTNRTLVTGDPTKYPPEHQPPQYYVICWHNSFGCRNELPPPGNSVQFAIIESFVLSVWIKNSVWFLFILWWLSDLICGSFIFYLRQYLCASNKRRETSYLVGFLTSYSLILFK